MNPFRRSPRTGPVLRALLLALPALAAASFAQDAPAEPAAPSWFPLEVGTTWSYTLHITRQGETQEVPYTVRVVRHEEVQGLNCAVLETRVGESLLETTWFGWEGKKLRNPRRVNKRSTLELREAGTEAGRIALDLEALPAAAALPPPVGPSPPSGPRWAWASQDEGAKGSISFLRREKLQLPGLGDLDCLVLLEVAEFKVGAKQARQERHWWLAAGVGLVQEVSRIELDGGEASETRAVLERKPERP